MGGKLGDIGRVKVTMVVELVLKQPHYEHFVNHSI